MHGVFVSSLCSAAGELFCYNQKMKAFKSRKQNRLKEYDYSEKGYYYITICTYNREEIFGIIEQNNMILNECGAIAKRLWLKITNHFPNIELDEYIVMPNHIHGIIIINNPVGTGHALYSNKNTKNNNLSVIIGSYKSAAAKQINQLNNNSLRWQRSFHDHSYAQIHLCRILVNT